MSTSLNFLLQATKVLHNRNYDDSELKIIYDYLISIDNETLNDYYNTTNILNYNNDLELYVDILKKMITIFENEDKQEYEKCASLIKKIKESIKIMETEK
jgi:hypothetical protein